MGTRVLIANAREDRFGMPPARNARLQGTLQSLSPDQVDMKTTDIRLTPVMLTKLC